MILKIENIDGNGYCYHEADEIEYFSSTVKKIKEESDCEGISWYLKSKEDEKILYFSLYNNERSSFRAIVSSRMTYLMNNNGKTIERLI